MTDATTTTLEGAPAPSLFEQPVVNIGQARDMLRRNPTVLAYSPAMTSSNLLLWAIMETLIEHKPKLAQSVLFNLLAALSVAQGQDYEGEEAALLRGVINRVRDLVAGLQIQGRAK